MEIILLNEKKNESPTTLTAELRFKFFHSATLETNSFFSEPFKMSKLVNCHNNNIFIYFI